MKKLVMASMLCASTSLLFAEAATETKLLPIFNGDYCAAPTVALMGGLKKYSESSNTGSYGAELRFGCPVFQIKSLDIRQVLSVLHADKRGFKTTSLEMNPRIMFPLTKDVEFGFGPGLGVVFADNGPGDDTVFGVNAGISIHYSLTNDIFVGLESRYQWTQKTDLAAGGTIDNLRTMVKVGTSF